MRPGRQPVGSPLQWTKRRASDGPGSTEWPSRGRSPAARKVGAGRRTMGLAGHPRRISSLLLSPPARLRDSIASSCGPPCSHAVSAACSAQRQLAKRNGCPAMRNQQRPSDTGPGPRSVCRHREQFPGSANAAIPGRSAHPPTGPARELLPGATTGVTVRPPHSSGATSASVWLSTHWCPNGSSMVACRSPYSQSCAGRRGAPSRHRLLDHFRDIGDLEHHLVRAFPFRRSPSRPHLGHHQLGRAARPAGRARRCPSPMRTCSTKPKTSVYHATADRTSATVRTGVTRACGADRFGSILSP